MVFNRVQSFLQAREPPRGPEFWVVRSTNGSFTVSWQVAAAVVKQLRRRIRPRWIRVVDLSGCELWLPIKSIELVYESTREQRAYDRSLRRQMEAEEDDDAPAWE